MLSFATEFPVLRTHSSADFLGAAKAWILGSPFTLFVESELAQVVSEGEWSAQKANERFESLRVESALEEAAAARYTRTDRGLEWVTTIVFSRQNSDSWIGIRVSCESRSPAARLPSAKKPVVVRTLLNQLGGAADGFLAVQSNPLLLANVDIDVAAQCITGRAGCRLPVVYVSAKFQGGHAVDVAGLANALSGMAHVVVEPNRPFSVRLMTEVEGQNVYGGTIGIYWPDGGGRRSFFVGPEYETVGDLKAAIIGEVQSALANRRPLDRCTWAAV